jgi:hypothetical protein
MVLMPTASEELTDLRQRLAAFVEERRTCAQRGRKQWNSYGAYAQGQFREMERVADEIEAEFLTPPAPTVASLTKWDGTGQRDIPCIVAEPVAAYGERER